MFGCADKFQAARISVKVGRAATEVAKSGIKTYAQGLHMECDAKVCLKLHPNKGPEYTKCLTAGHEAKPEWIACYAPAKRALAGSEPMWPAIHAAWNAADALIDAWEKSDQAGKQPTDQSAAWMKFGKEAVCMLVNVIKLIPEKSVAKVKTLINMASSLGGIACR
jgi:hypothetical protein